MRVYTHIYIYISYSGAPCPPESIQRNSNGFKVHRSSFGQSGKVSFFHSSPEHLAVHSVVRSVGHDLLLLRSLTKSYYFRNVHTERLSLYSGVFPLLMRLLLYANDSRLREDYEIHSTPSSGYIKAAFFDVTKMVLFC